MRNARDERTAKGERARPPRPGEPVDFRQLNLVGADLAGFDLSGCDLGGCDLSNADLRSTRLAGADLTDTILHGADLSGAELLGATLDRTDLTNATIANAGFGQTTGDRTLFFGCLGNQATFTGATLTGADFRTARLRETRFRGTTLDGALLDGADISHADLTSARLSDASLRDTMMEDTRLTKATGYETASWIGADLHRADFTGAWLLRRHAHDENYLDEFRTKSPMHEWLYRLWWVTSDCGRSLGRWTAWTVVIAVLYSFAYRFVSIDWGDHETALSPLYYSVVTFTTLGYGDVLPSSTAGQIMAMSEVILGYFSLGGMMSILSEKIARRAD